MERKEVHCRGYKLSVNHSSNHLGEGLRQEPIAVLTGHHLNRWASAQENGSERGVYAQDVGMYNNESTDAIPVDLETLAAGAMSSMCELAQHARTQFRLLSYHSFSFIWKIYNRTVLEMLLLKCNRLQITPLKCVLMV